jgi:phenylacetaldehyde dehydrogenase
MTSLPSRRDTRPQVDLIDGTWALPRVVLEATIDDPNTGDPLQPQLATAATDVDRALAVADAVHSGGRWATTGVDVRAAILDDIAAGLTARIDELAYEDAMATGNAIRVSRQMASYIGPRVSSARRQLSEVGITQDLTVDGRPVTLLRRPLGPAVVLAPWNAPTFVAVAKVASALATGCPVILKPSEWAPAGCQIVAEVVHEVLERHGAPASAFQLVRGDATVGAQLASDVRVKAISFTGGGPGGRAVARAAAPNLTALQLELGGHNPAIILPDADVRTAAVALVDGMTKLNGQWCEAPGKVLVPAALHDELVEHLLDQLGALTIGHCLDQQTDVGPLAYREHRDRLLAGIAELTRAGGQTLTRTPLPDLSGWFLAPTVITGLDASQSIHELFGPVMTIHKVGSLDEALIAADGPETGLAGFVFGADHALALQVAARIPAGEVRVNGCKLADLADGSEQTFWNGAGIGGHGPTDMVRFFQGRQTIGVDDPSLPI